MAIRKNESADPGPADAAAPDLADAPELTRTELTNTVLRLPGSRLPWTYIGNPAQLHCVDGYIVPRLYKAPHEPGFHGNAPGPNRGEGAVAHAISQGGVQIPHDMTGLVAFGKRATGGLSHYLSKWEGVTADGKPCVYVTSRWHRPIQLGMQMRWEFDREGWLGFLRKTLKLVVPGGLQPIHIQIAIEPQIMKARRLLDHDQSDARDRMLRQVASQLPREHAEPGLIPFYEGK